MFKDRRIHTVLCQGIDTENAADKFWQGNSYPPSVGGWGWAVVLVAWTNYLLVSGFHSAFGCYMRALPDSSHSSGSEGGRSSVHKINL